MAVATSIVLGGIAAAVGATTNAIAAKKAKEGAADAKLEAGMKQSALDALVEDRPVFNNPYENITYDPNNTSLGQSYNEAYSSSSGDQFPMMSFPSGDNMLNYNPALMENHVAYNNEGVSTGGWPAVSAHEQGHYGVDRINKKQRKALKSIINWPALNNFAGDNNEAYDHGRDPYEMRANLTQLRYQLDKAGIYNSSKGLAVGAEGEDGDNPFTDEHLKQILDFNENGEMIRIKPEFNNEILQFIAPQDIIWMMNNIAMDNDIKDDELGGRELSLIHI